MASSPAGIPGLAGKQDQTVSEGGQAIQAGGDVTVGMTPEQALAFLDHAGKAALAHYTAEAQSLVDKRFDKLQEKLVERFFTPGKDANPEAFKDPDFQYLLTGAQEAYARSGDSAVADTLVDIIARRSEAKTHSREALTLNEAAVRAPRLTNAEFAALSLCYLVRYTVNNGLVNTPTFAAYINNALVPFVDDVSLENSSFWHIEAESCGTLNEISTVELRGVLADRYGGVLGKGAAMADFEGNAPPQSAHLVKELVIPCLRDRSKMQPNATNEEKFKEKLARLDYDPQLGTTMWTIYAPTIPAQDDMIKMLEPEIPRIGRLFEVWEKSSLKNLTLNSVGIAIGHANAKRVVGFAAPLNIWIK